MQLIEFRLQEPNPVHFNCLRLYDINFKNKKSAKNTGYFLETLFVCVHSNS